MPRVIREAPQRAVVGDPRVVDQKVHTAQLVLDGLDKRLHVVPLSYVTALAEHTHALGSQRRFGEECLLENITARQLHVVEGHVDPAAGKFETDGPTETGGTTRDHDDLAVHWLGLRRCLLRLLNQHRARRPLPRRRAPGTLVRSVGNGYLMLLRASRT